MLHIACLESGIVYLVSATEVVVDHIDEVHAGKVVGEAEHITGDFQLVTGGCAVAYALELLHGNVKLSLWCLLYLDVDEWQPFILDPVHLDATIDDCPCARKVHIDGCLRQTLIA